MKITVLYIVLFTMPMYIICQIKTEQMELISKKMNLFHREAKRIDANIYKITNSFTGKTLLWDLET